MGIQNLGRALVAVALVSGCAADEATDPGADQASGKADQISGKDDPSGLLANAERRLSKLVTPADIGMTFGMDDDKVPYPDTYWPMVDNGVAVQWAEASGRECDIVNKCNSPQPSPLEKYMSLFDPTRSKDAVAWEIKNHGKDVPKVQDWFGHCPGWTAAAQLNHPITAPLFVKSDGQGGVSKCTAGEPGCVKLEIGDLDGLQAEAYNNARSRFVGARCDTEPTKIKRDEFGRILRDGTGCGGLNAGSMLIITTNLLKLDKKPFGIDAQNEFNTDQIWNQPAYRYTVNRFERLTTSEAANLVASGKKTGDKTTYIWNSMAKGFALIDFTLQWVAETPGPNVSVVSGVETTRETRMVAVIELDRPPSSTAARVIGGEFVDDESVGANRLRTQPFVWTAVSVGPDDGQGHNPFVKGAKVEALVQLALGATSSSTCAHPVCTAGGKLTATCDSCAATVCGADQFCCSSSWDATCVQEARSKCGATCP